MKQTLEAEVTPRIEASVSSPSMLPFASPWSANDLQRMIWKDIFGAEMPITTRGAAMRLSPVSGIRHKIVAVGAPLPLVAKTGDTPLADQPAWIWAALDGTSPQHTMVWTLDDLYFHGWCLWWRRNDPVTGFPLARGRIPFSDWEFNQDGGIDVNGITQKAADLILIPGFHEGILNFGEDVLSDAQFMHKVVRSRLLNPVPGLDLHQVSGADLTETEIDAVLARWITARQGGNAGVSFTSKHIEAREMGKDSDMQLLIEGRNAVAVEVARMSGLPAGVIDATTPKASLNYETKTGRNEELVDNVAALYLEPVAARLSMDDVTPPGVRVDFDRTDLVSPAPEPLGITQAD